MRLKHLKPQHGEARDRAAELQAGGGNASPQRTRRSPRRRIRHKLKSALEALWNRTPASPANPFAAEDGGEALSTAPMFELGCGTLLPPMEPAPPRNATKAKGTPRALGAAPTHFHRLRAAAPKPGGGGRLACALPRQQRRHGTNGHRPADGASTRGTPLSRASTA